MTRHDLLRLARQGDPVARNYLLFGPPVMPTPDELLAALRLVLRNLETHGVVLPSTLETLARLDERAEQVEDLRAAED